MILLIDNYDSFTYNLVHYVEELGQSVKVYRNDKISINKIARLNPKKIIISPGPCTPNEAGICIELIKNFIKNSYTRSVSWTSIDWSSIWCKDNKILNNYAWKNFYYEKLGIKNF